MIPLRIKLGEKFLRLQIKDISYKVVSKSLREDEKMIPKYEGYSLYSDGLLLLHERIYVTSNEDVCQLI